MVNLYDVPEPRVTRDHYEITSIRDGIKAPIITRADTLNEAREIADRMAAGRTDRPCVIELGWRQRLCVVEDRNAVVISTCRILNMGERVYS